MSVDLDKIRAMLPNQCMGCQAEWPIVGEGYIPGGFRGLLHHKPRHGYRYSDRVVCTKARYA